MKPATFDKVNGNSSGQSANQREPEVSGAQWYANTPGTSARRYTLLRAAGSLRHATTGGAPHDPSMLSADVPPTPWTRNSIASMLYAALVELHVVAFGVAQEDAPHSTARRFAVHDRVGARAFATHHDRHAGCAHARHHLVEVVDPEREVVAAHLEELRGLAHGLVGDLLVEHDEARVRAVDPAEVHGPPLRRFLAWSLRELFDLVGGHAHAEHVAVEAEGQVHVADADRDVRHRLDAHGRTTSNSCRCTMWADDVPITTE